MDSGCGGCSAIPDTKNEVGSDGHKCPHNIRYEYFSELK